MMDERDRHEAPRDPARSIKSLLLVAIGILAIIFFVMNDQSVEVSFIFTTVDTPLVWALLISLILGFLAGWLVNSFGRRR